MKELTEAPMANAFRTRFDLARSFDLDDDLEFCPGLLTEDDVCDLLDKPTWHNQLPSFIINILFFLKIY